MRELVGECHVPGAGGGRVVFADLGLSFMGGVDASTGMVIDTHHPLHGQSVAGAVLAMPSGRGSCSGSLVMFELLLNGHAPRALVTRHRETILTLGVIVAHELFERGIPVVCLGDQFDQMATGRYAHVRDNAVTVTDEPVDVPSHAEPLPLDLTGVTLSDADVRMLNGDDGPAAQAAMRIVVRTAHLEQATELVDVEMAHIDGCFYQGPGNVAFARRLLQLGASVKVPSTTNAICVDRCQWQRQGVDPTVGAASEELADAFVTMGVRPTFTCAPYLLEPQPAFGQHIAWGESNAVVFANSVLGARTLKYPDYLDILVAITGRAPFADCHVSSGRRPTLRIDVPTPLQPDDAYFALLGYHVGKISPNDIPVITGLDDVSISTDDLKGFGAAFATTSAVAMFHIVGVTPEAATLDMVADGELPVRQVTLADLHATWSEMTTAESERVDVVSLGNPHFSLTELAQLASLCADLRVADEVDVLVACGRDVYLQAERAGYVDTIRDFGARFLNDTCWCFIDEPVIPPSATSIATNSGKYAHYGPAAVRQRFHFASLRRCVDAARNGRIDVSPPSWLGVDGDAHLIRR